MFSKKFWMDTAERVIVTMAQVALLFFGLDEFSTDLHVDFGTIGIAVLGGGVICLLKCLVASRVGSPDTAALLFKGPDTDRGDVTLNTAVVVLGVLAVFLLGLISCRVGLFS